MAKVPKVCVFCSGDGPFTAEHILPEWTARLLGVQRLQVQATRGDDLVKTWQAVGTFGTTVKRVCAGCNSGWMSELENIAKPILRDLIRSSSPRSLNADEQLVIASWVLKTCVVHECATNQRYFTDAERRCLFNDEEGHPPIGSVRIWLATHSGRRVGNILGGPATFSSPTGHKVDAILVTMSIWWFAAQLLAIRTAPGEELHALAHRNFATAEREIWPQPASDVQWPPEDSLDDATFKLWHRRWENPPTNS